MRRARARHEKISAELIAQIHERDQGCVGPRVGFPGDCAGRIEDDHVRAGGMGIKSRSTLDNMVELCSGHHRWKTEHGREARPLLIGWISAHA